MVPGICLDFSRRSFPSCSQAGREARSILPAHGELSAAAQALTLPWSRPRAWAACWVGACWVGACSAPSSRSMAAFRSALGWASLVPTCHPGLGPLLSLNCRHLRLQLAWLSTVFPHDGPSVPDDGDLGHSEGQAAQGSHLGLGSGVAAPGVGFLPRGCGLAPSGSPDRTGPPRPARGPAPSIGCSGSSGLS